MNELDGQQRTGLDEALDRVNHVIKMANKTQIPWYNIRERWISYGAMSVLKMVRDLLFQLQCKYDNKTGRLN